MIKFRFNLSVAALCVLQYNFALAQEQVQLDTVIVKMAFSNRKFLKSKISETTRKQQVQDSRDLVRYETGVTVVETGRMGSSGYAVRGVDENRVAITVDGLHQAETLSSQGFKELFEGTAILIILATR
ncbi:hemoglobin and hemoglobin-haptoglobin-binding protein 4 [Actinobacillus equuli]|nr:hemoglobin and hemoglobin-haptoglobin-binding protein 4 [Actinobacillus equuli]